MADSHPIIQRLCHCHIRDTQTPTHLCTQRPLCRVPPRAPRAPGCDSSPKGPRPVLATFLSLPLMDLTFATAAGGLPHPVAALMTADIFPSFPLPLFSIFDATSLPLYLPISLCSSLPCRCALWLAKPSLIDSIRCPSDQPGLFNLSAFTLFQFALGPSSVPSSRCRPF